MTQLQLLENDFRYHKKYIDGKLKSKQEIVEHLRKEGKTEIIHVLSFGGGTQSAHLLEAHLQGEIHYDYIVFSDTGAEPDFIHEQVKWWQERQKQLKNTTPFIVTGHKSMPGGLEEMLWRYIETDYQRFQMPLYFSKINEEGREVSAGMTPRQCTIDFKIVPVKQAVRKMIMKKKGLKDTKRFPEEVAVIQDIGFSYDEINRVNMWQSPQYKYFYMSYPLVEKGLTTEDSIDFLRANDFPLKRSRCYLCPFNCGADKNNGMDWEEIIYEEPLSFLKACWFDSKLRSIIEKGEKRLTSIPFFHFSRQPLATVYSEVFDLLIEKHATELENWTLKWSDYIENQYKKALD